MTSHVTVKLYRKEHKTTTKTRMPNMVKRTNKTTRERENYHKETKENETLTHTVIQYNQVQNAPKETK